jgi:hypothetical protein
LWIWGTIAKTAPLPPCTNTDATATTATPAASGQLWSSSASTANDTAVPARATTTQRRRLAAASETMPPPGRVTRLVKAKALPAALAAPIWRPNVDAKNVGRSDTTASSAPNVTP